MHHARRTSGASGARQRGFGAAEAGTAGCRIRTGNATRRNARALDGPGTACNRGASAAASRHNGADAATCRNAAIK